MRIPNEAIEAAAGAVRDAQNVPFTGPKQRKIARAALEAAIPFLSLTNEDPHFGCPDCGEREGCDCRWKGVL